MPENIAQMLEYVQRSPRRSAHRQPVVLGMSDRSVQGILQGIFTGNLNLFLLMTYEAHFHLNVTVHKKILSTRLIITHKNFMNIPFMSQTCQCGVGYQL